VSDAELDVLRASIGTDQDRSRPAPHAISSRDLLPRILHQGEREPQTPANFSERVAVLAAMERYDEWWFSPSLSQPLQAAELRQTPVTVAHPRTSLARSVPSAY
jgi:hypothetical protein